MNPIDKRTLVDQLIAAVRDELAVLTQVAHATREAATHEEARPENDKDTRAVEAAYLAGAQAERVRDLQYVAAALHAMPVRAFAPGEKISAAALVTVSIDGDEAHYLVAPQGGGMSARVGDVAVQVVTPRSPLGRALLGKAVGDIAEVQSQHALREYTIIAVH